MRDIPPLKSLQAFEAAARRESFASAAEELHLTPSAISHQIRLLEERLGMALFHRVNRRVLLTDAGRRYANAVAQSFSIIEAATRRVSQHNKSDLLSIHCAPTLATQWLMPRLSRFSARYPNIDVRLNAAVGEVNLVNEQFDLDIRYGIGTSESGVITDPLPHEPHIVVCSPELALGDHPIRSPQDLEHHTLIHSEVNLFGWRDWQRKHPNVALNLTRGPRFSRTFMSISAAVDGLGVAFESRLMVEKELESRRLVAPLDEIRASMTLHRLRYLASKAHLPKIVVFREWFFEQLDNTFQNMTPVGTDH